MNAAATAISRAVVAVLGVLSHGARADVAPPPQPALEEIIVTAQRREERLLDVPVSVSVYSSADLERLQIKTVSDLQETAPNLTITPYPGTQTRATIAMRGQVETDLFPTLDPAVGLYVDGVYIARMAGANLDLIDIQRVEVLRGPQGTLFGRNTIGGAIDLIPRRPTRDLTGTFSVNTGNYDLLDLTAIVNVPVFDDFALRVAASHREHSGYGDNTLLDHDLNAESSGFARIQLDLVPAEGWDLNLSFDYTNADEPRNLVTLVAAFPPNTLVPAASGTPTDSIAGYVDPLTRDVRANRIGTTDADIWGTSATLTIELGGFTAKAISAYRKLDSSDTGLDLDATRYDLFTVFEREEHQHQFSQELQAYGDAMAQRLDWIGGVFYFHETGKFSQRLGAVAPVTLSEVVNVPGGTANNESISAYAQLTYTLVPAVRITSGVRYNEDRRRLTSRNARVTNGFQACTLAAAVLDEPGVCQATLPYETFRYTPWMIGLDFESDATLLYAKVSRGHRAGGYNMRGTSEFDLDTFDPEHVTTYEAGARAELREGRVRLDLTLYRSSYDDIQLIQRQVFAGVALPLPVIRNGGEARIDGGEFELATLLQSWRVGATVGVTHAHYTQLDPSVLEVTRNSNFQQTPKTTASIALDAPPIRTFTDIHAHVDYAWRDEVAFRYDPRSLAKQKDYGLINVRLTTQLDRGKFELALWARNLTDKHYLVRVTDSVSLVNAMPGDPRTYGITLKYQSVGS